MADAGAMEWTLEEKRDFEEAMVEVPETPEKLANIAAQMGKPVGEIMYHYEKLVDTAIMESGGDVIEPEYSPPSPTTITPKKWTIAQVPETPAKLETRKPVEDEKLVQDAEVIKSSTRLLTPMERGSRWSAEEHKRLLRGLKALGPGDWRGISRNYVITRDPIQVTAYAHRFLNKAKKAEKAEKQED